MHSACERNGIWLTTWIKKINRTIAVFHHVIPTTFDHAIRLQIWQILQMKHLVGYLIGYPCIIEITLSICGRKTAKFLWCFIQSRFYCHFDCITGRNESPVWRPFAIAMYNNLNHFRNEVNTADWICFVAGFYRSANPSASFSVSIPVDVIHHTKPRPDAIFMRLQWPRQIGMLLKKKKKHSAWQQRISSIVSDASF